MAASDINDAHQFHLYQLINTLLYNNLLFVAGSFMAMLEHSVLLVMESPLSSSQMVLLVSAQR